MSVEIKTVEVVKCKHCDSEAVVKFGSYKGVPRYYCKVCKRKFKHDDKQFKMKSETEQVATALHDYYDGGSSVRAIGRHILAETGNQPSTATIYEWIQKYTQYITDSIKDYHPQVGNVWIADETVLKIGGQKVWLWDIIDDKTRYLLASRLSTTRTTRNAQILMDRAVKTAGKHPKAVITDKLSAYLDIDYGKDVEHRQGSPFSAEDSTSKIERWHGTIKNRTKVMRDLKNLETAHSFVDGFLAYYNYLRPHESLDGKTPAQEAGITYPYQNWNELIRTHKPSRKVVIEHIKRGTLEFKGAHFGRQRQTRITSLSPPITPPRSKLPRGDYYVGRGMISRHRFDGSKARRGRIL